MTFGRLATALGAVAVGGIGAVALRWPETCARSYGIPSAHPDTIAYVRAVAARDLVMGGFVLWAAISGDRPAMRAGLLLSTLAPVADLLLAYNRSGAVPQLAIHGAGVIGVMAAYAIVSAESS